MTRMSEIYNYIGFGLNISSDIKFPELLLSGDNPADIIIRNGQIPDDLFPDNDLSQFQIHFHVKKFLLNMPGIARYIATEGNEVIIDAYPGSDPGTVRLFCLSITMAAVLTQRHKILLHSSAIIFNEKLVLFLGDSGAGKSSIAAELSKRNYTIFSDDVCVLEPRSEKNNEVLAFSSYPMMKLWDDTVKELNNLKFDKIYKIRPELEKYGHFFHEKFITKPYPIKKIFVLNPTDNEQEGYSFRKLKGMEAFEKLSIHTYRRQFIQDSTLQVIHVKTLSSLVQKTEIFEVSRSTKKSKIEVFTDFVESIICRDSTSYY